MAPRRHIPVKGRRGIYWSETAKGKVYEARYRDSTGKDVFKTTGPRLQDALDFQADIRVRLNRGERVISTSKPFSEVAREWEMFRLGTGTVLAPNTVKTYKSHLKNHILPEFQNRKVGKITADQIFLWLRDLTLSGATKEAVYSVLHDVLEFAASRRRGYINRNPCDDLERGERPKADEYPVRILLPDESIALLTASPEWLKPIIQTGLLSGVRAGEAIGLRWEDIDFSKATLHVRRQIQDGKPVPPKGGKTRQVTLFPALRQIMFSRPSRFGGGWVFQNNTGNALIYNTLSEAFARARKKAKLSVDPRPLRFHDLRHTFASALLQDGKDIQWVSEMLGHANTDITMKTYAHVMYREDRGEDGSMRLGRALGEWANG